MAKIRRFYDAKTLNKAANLPEVLPQVAPGYESIDLSGCLKKQGTIALKCGRAVMLFAARSKKGVYEAHYLFPADIRGKEALGVVKDMLREVFTTYRARVIVGDVPLSHMPARIMSRAAGCLPCGRRYDALGRECIHYRLERDKWAGL